MLVGHKVSIGPFANTDMATYRPNLLRSWLSKK